MGVLRRFGRDRSGVSAIEFAMIAPLFFALVFSTIETGWIMVRSTALDRALDIAVRQVRIGAKPDQAAMKAAICANMTLVVHACASAMLVEMTTVSSATDIPSTGAKCIDRGSTVAQSGAYTTGTEQATLFVRACLVADPLTPLIGVALALPKDALGGYWLVASSAFKKEPEKNK
ncbi:TadE/TadG family type IV pilus assembly protein [Aureimonas jatrophae]|uniref:Flp pilus assembly protein TadG n=1 Tax=Aureimonas jatrophae TaxID=1166073 RepID=A0A1H0CHW6_9HYPH|nr:TadE/TadG family type IV pilus assembly protein [Aureimonas jatrophae]MBB3949239.1 Flp pilus assembly protein TadG [Aureimonas jatrophae]SDN57442.1 Flp pilus assembly protein TadG [Aureimonas jatrophae]